MVQSFYLIFADIIGSSGRNGQDPHSELWQVVNAHFMERIMARLLVRTAARAKSDT